MFPGHLLLVGSFNIVDTNFLREKTLVFTFPFASLISGPTTVLEFINYILTFTSSSGEFSGFLKRRQHLGIMSYLALRKAAAGSWK